MNAPHLEAAPRALQGTLDDEGRSKLAGVMSDALASAGHVPRYQCPDSERIGIRDDGYVSLGMVLPTDAVLETTRYLRSKPVYLAHVKGHSPTDRQVPLEEAATCSRYACHGLADVIKAPHLLELANDPRVLRVVEAYFGCAPSLYSLGAFWTFPGDLPLAEGIDNGVIHRDRDDVKSCTLFVFLTDVSADDGSHHFLRKSHNPHAMSAWVQGQVGKNPGVPPQFDMETVLDGSSFLAPLLMCSEGRAGTAVIEDTYGLHSAGQILTPRLIFWARYGYYRNTGHQAANFGTARWSDVAGRIPRDPYHAFVNCMILDD